MKWDFGVKRPIDLLDTSLTLRGDLKELSELIGIGYSKSFVIIENGMGIYYAPKVEVEKQVEILTTDLDKTKKLLAKFPYFKAKLQKALKELVKQVDNKEYSLDLFKDFFRAYRQYVVFRIPTRVLGYQKDLPKEFIEEVGQIRMDYKNKLIEIRKVLDEIWSKIAKHHKISKGVIKFLTMKEFLDSLSRNKFDLRFLERSKKKLVLYRDKHSERILVDKKAEKFIKSALGETKIEKINIIKGQTACLGSAIGVVRIVLKAEKIKTERKFILVTSMTTPDFVPILKNVKAIITDEGGLTSHAAIIARELKIPCIIGTKIATKVLKDGDLVEVDADKGVVKIIKE